MESSWETAFLSKFNFLLLLPVSVSKHEMSFSVGNILPLPNSTWHVPLINVVMMFRYTLCIVMAAQFWWTQKAEQTTNVRKYHFSMQLPKRYERDPKRDCEYEVIIRVRYGFGCRWINQFLLIPGVLQSVIISLHDFYEKTIRWLWIWSYRKEKEKRLFVFPCVRSSVYFMPGIKYILMRTNYMYVVHIAFSVQKRR